MLFIVKNIIRKIMLFECFQCILLLCMCKDLEMQKSCLIYILNFYTVEILLY